MLIVLNRTLYYFVSTYISNQLQILMFLTNLIINLNLKCFIHIIQNKKGTLVNFKQLSITE